jgi:hypothetical protein
MRNRASPAAAIMRTTLKPLFNLAIAALISQLAPEWGAHLLSCGFTHALRTIQSAEATKGETPLFARFNRT